MVRERLRRVPERLRHASADARGPGDQDRGQPGAPGQPGSPLHPGTGGPAGVVQPGPLPRPAAAPHDQCGRRAIGIRAGELGSGRERARRARPRPGGGRQRGSHRGRHPAPVGDAGRPGRPLGRRRGRSAPTAVRGIRLRAAAGRPRDRLRTRRRPLSRFRSGGPDRVVRRRLPGDLAVDRQPRPSLRGCPTSRQRAHGARRSFRVPPLADRVERGRVDPHRAGRRGSGGGGDGENHRGGGAGPGGRHHRRGSDPHPHPGRRLDPRGGRRAKRRAGRPHRPACAGVLGSGGRAGPDAGRGSRGRRLGTERHRDPGSGRAAELRRGQRRRDRTVRAGRPVGQSVDVRRPARPRRRDARRRDRGADPAPGQSRAHFARRRRLRRGAGRRAFRRRDVELAGRDDGASRPDPARAHPARVVGRPPARGGPVQPDAADHAAAVRHAPFRRHPARGRPPRAGRSGGGGSRGAGRRTDPPRGRVLRGAAGRVARPSRPRLDPPQEPAAEPEPADAEPQDPAAARRAAARCPPRGSRRAAGSRGRVRSILGGRRPAGRTLVPRGAGAGGARRRARRKSTWRGSPRPATRGAR